MMNTFLTKAEALTKRGLENMFAKPLESCQAINTGLQKKLSEMPSRQWSKEVIIRLVGAHLQLSLTKLCTF